MQRDAQRRFPPHSAGEILCRLLAIAFLAVGVAACGGGGGSQPAGPPPPSPQFRFSVSPANVNVQPGGSGAVTVSAYAWNGFTGDVTVQVGGLPAGVTASPLSFAPGPPPAPGDSAQLTFSADSSAPLTTVSLTLTASGDSLTQTASLSLTVAPIITSNAPTFRTRWVRTDSATPYAALYNPEWEVLNPPTGRLFVTDPYLNRVIVLDDSTQAVIGSIPVPGAYGIDDTPDHSTLWVGTLIGDVYEIDPVSMTVLHRYLASQIGPQGFTAEYVFVMADGNLALLSSKGNPLDGWGGFAVWNPATNAFTDYNVLSACGPVQGTDVLSSLVRSPTRGNLFYSTFGGYCDFNYDTHAFSYIPIMGRLALSPDGKWIVIDDGGEALVLDASSLAQVNQFPVFSWADSIQQYFFVGADSRTLYCVTESLVYAYDLTNGNLLGWFPNMYVLLPFGGTQYGTVGPNIQAMDGTGLLMGPASEGVGFLDSAAMQTSAAPTITTMGGFVKPATGTVAGGTQVSWVAAGPASPTKVYIGSQAATSVGPSGGNSETLTALTPSGAPGPADLYSLDAGGGVMQYLPEVFSYGPTVLEVTPNIAITGSDPSSPYDYSATGTVFGYGFAPLSSSTAPSDLGVTVGGQPTTITSFAPNAYPVGAQPFPLESATFNIPDATSGSADVTVTTSSGSATATGAVKYLPPLQFFSLPGAALAQGVYDPYTDLYYFTDATQIQVFSKTDGAWLAPIPIPGAQRLWGIAVSQDGSTIAVGDIEGSAVYTLDPNNPSSVRTFALPQTSQNGYVPLQAVALAAGDSGIVYIKTGFYSGGRFSGLGPLYRLDTNAGQFTDITDTRDAGAGSNPGPYQWMAFNPANSLLYVNWGRIVSVLDSATGQWTAASWSGGSSDLALSGDGTRLAAAEYFSDANLVPESFMTLNDREGASISYLYGQKLSPDGRLLFQPSTEGIDVFDGHLGTLMDRIALPVPLSPNYDALVSDGKDNVLVGITGANGDGIAVIDLSSIAEPPLPSYDAAIAKLHIRPMAKPAPRTNVPVRGGAPGSKGRRVSLFPAERIPYVTSHRLLRPVAARPQHP